MSTIWCVVSHQNDPRTGTLTVRYETHPQGLRLIVHSHRHHIGGSGPSYFHVLFRLRGFVENLVVSYFDITSDILSTGSFFQLLLASTCGTFSHSQPYLVFHRHSSQYPSVQKTASMVIGRSPSNQTTKQANKHRSLGVINFKNVSSLHLYRGYLSLKRANCRH